MGACSTLCLSVYQHTGACTTHACLYVRCVLLTEVRTGTYPRIHICPEELLPCQIWHFLFSLNDELFSMGSDNWTQPCWILFGVFTSLSNMTFLMLQMESKVPWQVCCSWLNICILIDYLSYEKKLIPVALFVSCKFQSKQQVVLFQSVSTLKMCIKLISVTFVCCKFEMRTVRR